MTTADEQFETVKFNVGLDSVLTDTLCLGDCLRGDGYEYGDDTKL
jgi:hypothetical protein